MLGGSLVSCMVVILVGPGAFCLNRLSVWVISLMVIGGQSPFSLVKSPCSKVLIWSKLSVTVCSMELMWS